MSLATYQWVKAAHLLGVVLWIGGLSTVYWLLRIHAHAPKDVHERLTLMERALAMMMDIAATATIGCGLALAINGFPGVPTNWFKVTDYNRPWLHVKLTIVVLAILPIHGMVRARVKKFGQGKIAPVPEWLWTLLLAGVMAAVILASTKMQM
jgi:uncharacterized membrane protein